MTKTTQLFLLEILGESNEDEEGEEELEEDTKLAGF